MLLEYLKKTYKPGEPIFLSDINIPEMTDENLRYHLKKYTDDGILCRFEPGIYYLPKRNNLGEQSALSTDTVAINKYISRRGKRVGYYSGYTLANRLGLSSQVPFVEEITSNYAPASVREITIKNRRYLIRRPSVSINENNAAVLQLLECLKDIDRCADVNMESCGEILSRYISNNRITKKDIDQYISVYPAKVYKAIYETGVKYVSS